MIQSGSEVLSLSASISPSTINLEYGSTASYAQQLTLTPNVPCNLSIRLRDSWIRYYFRSFPNVTWAGINTPPLIIPLTFIPYGNLSIGTYYYSYDIYEWPSGSFLTSVTTTLKVQSHEQIQNATRYQNFLPADYSSGQPVYPSITITIDPLILSMNESDTAAKYVFCNVTSSVTTQYKWGVTNMNIYELESNPNVLAFVNCLRAWNIISLSGDAYDFKSRMWIIRVASLPPEALTYLKACGKNVTVRVEFYVISTYNPQPTDGILKSVLVTFTYRARVTGRVVSIGISPSTITGKQQEVYQFQLVLISNYVSTFSWVTIQTYGYLSDKYVQFGGLPVQLKSGEVYVGTVRLPKVILNQTLTFKIIDIYDPSFYNSTQMTINCLGSGVSTFDAIVDPNTIFLTPNMLWNLRAHVYSLDGVSRIYYMNVRNSYAGLTVTPSGVTSIGSGTDLYQDIQIKALSTAYNGTFTVEFVFYYDQTHYLSRSVSVIISGSYVQPSGEQTQGGINQTTGTGTTTGLTSPFGNQQATFPTISVNPVTGPIQAAIEYVSQISGIPSVGIGMGLGVIFLLIPILIVASVGVTSVAVYGGIFVIMVFLNTILGLFPWWSALIVGVLTVALFSRSVTGVIFNRGGEPET